MRISFSKMSVSTILIACLIEDYMSVFYLGSFPPTYGGVTVKNEILFTALASKIHIKRIDFNRIKKIDWGEMCRLIFAIMNPKNCFVIGVSGKKTRRRLTQLLFYCNRKAMQNSVLVVMGGTAHHDMSVDVEYKKSANVYKKIYVETQTMKNEMNEAGFVNVDIYPNCRFSPQCYRVDRVNDEKLKCVFFSRIQPEKGADLVLEVAKELQEVQFVFYGEINKTYQADFLSSVNALKNVSYYGVFRGSNEEVYSELAKYDLLLFPTRWENEGVPGILIEGKIAGIAEIVSDKNYNAEIVLHGVEGVVLKKNTSKELVSVIQNLAKNRALIERLKNGSCQSAKQYFIENYIDGIVRTIIE